VYPLILEQKKWPKRPEHLNYNPIMANAIKGSRLFLMNQAAIQLRNLLNPFQLPLEKNEGVNSQTLTESSFERLVAVMEAGPKLPQLLSQRFKGNEDAVKEVFKALLGSNTIEEAEAMLKQRLGKETVYSPANGNNNWTRLEKGGLEVTLYALANNNDELMKSKSMHDLTSLITSYIFNEPEPTP
jgi:hypothetical protein